MYEVSSTLEVLHDAGIALPEGAHSLLSWLAALVGLLSLTTTSALLFAATLVALRMVRVAWHQLLQPVRPKEERAPLIQLLRDLLGADKRS